MVGCGGSGSTEEILAPEERQWLDEHAGEVTAPVGLQGPPFGFYDDEGEYVGLAVDFIELIEEKLGVRFVRTPVPTWQEWIERFRSHEISIGFMEATPERADWGLFTEPLIEIPYVIVVPKDDRVTSSLNDLHGKAVVVVDELLMEEHLSDDYPFLELERVPDDLTGLLSVSFGSADAMVVSLAYATYLVEERQITNLRVAGETGFVNRPSIVCRNDWPELHRILEKAIDSITPEEEEAILRKWIYLEHHAGQDWKAWVIPLLGGVGALLMVAGGVAVWNRMLRREVRRKTFELEREYAERSRAEESLRKWGHVFQNAEWGVAVIGPAGTGFQMMNPAFASMLRYAIEDLADASLESLVSPADRGGLAEHIREADRAGRRTFESTFVRRDGSTFAALIDVTSVKDMDGIVQYRAVHVHDISTQKEAAEAILRKNRELTVLNSIIQTISQSPALDEILDSAVEKTVETLGITHGGIYLLDEDGETLTLAAQRGLPPQLVPRISRVITPNNFLRRAVESGQPAYVESMDDAGEGIGAEDRDMMRRAGVRSGMFVPLRAGGDVVGVMAAATGAERTFAPEERDLLITIGHAVSTAIHNALLLEAASRARTLEEIDRLRTALLASVSHELRTPLTSIKGIASTLLQPDIQWDDETRMDLLKSLDRSTDRLTRIVDDLMDMSQLEAGVMRMDKREVSVSAIVSQLEGQLRDMAPEHDLVIEVPSSMPLVYGDEVRIGQVIINLVANAVAYSEEGTSIVLAARHVDEGIIVSVEDMGVGIPREDLDNVFNRFYRLQSTAHRYKAGSGLGLSISKGIIEAHGGRIWVESRVGQGSKFSFSLPVVRN